ncbi:MAG: hypothetical protein QGF09_03935 [Rhodospirillales bacterium]|nr:hypothetical protein [Rhodospirillales bacterium]
MEVKSAACWDSSEAALSTSVAELPVSDEAWLTPSILLATSLVAADCSSMEAEMAVATSLISPMVPAIY